MAIRLYFIEIMYFMHSIAQFCCSNLSEKWECTTKLDRLAFCADEDKTIYQPKTRV